MALTFNLPSQIVVQTAAQWAVDATVYSNKRILVTSDEYYGSTDQRKFKIADGTQTWAQLDYFPLDVALALTLQQVIDNGNNLNGLMAQSNDTFSKVYVEDGDIDLYYNNGSVFSRIILSALGTQIKHTNQIDLDAPLVTFLQGYFTGMDNNFLAHLQQTYTLFAFAGNRKGSKLFMDADQIYSFWENTLSGVSGKVLVDTTNTKLEHTNLIELTAPSVTKNGSEILTSANITQVITNGVTDKAPSEDAVYDALATKQDGLIFKQNTTITHTGTISPTVIASFAIPLNFNEANDFWNIWGMCGVDITGGGAGNNQIRMYIGSNPTDITGATYTASIFVSSTLRTYPIARTFVFKNSLTTFEGSAATTDNVQTDYTTFSNAPASVTIDFSTQKYLHILCILANVGNIIYLRSLYSKILR